jgi:ABC-type multidrug transport system fused ATPase/permease subunit
VGASGAGKSTIAKLLLGFLKPDSGEIMVGNLPLTDIQTAAWREKVSWVSQFPYLFNASVADNIRMARPEAPMEEIVEAARMANADGFIQRLPEGYETMIGERAVNLSGGQAQRIALARAFLKNAPLIVLDEPAANLDPNSVALLQEALNRILVGRTAVVIAHRLSTIRQADHIVVLDRGQVVQTGGQMTLLSTDGPYRRLVEAASGGKR